MNNAVWASECWHLCKVQLSFPLSINRKRDSGWCGGFIFRHLRNLFSVGPAITCCLLSSFWMAPIPVWANTSSSHRGLDSHLRTGNLRILSDTRWPLGWGKRGSKHVYVGICAPVWKPSPPFPLVSLKDTGFLTEPGAHNVYGLPSKLQEFSSLCLPKTGITGTHTWTCFAVVVALVWLFWVLFLSLFNVSSVNEAQHTFITSISPIEPSAWSSLAILMSSLKKMHAPLFSWGVSFCPVCLPLSWGSPLHSVNSNHFINTRFVNLSSNPWAAFCCFLFCAKFYSLLSFQIFVFASVDWGIHCQDHHCQGRFGFLGFFLTLFSLEF